MKPDSAPSNDPSSELIGKKRPPFFLTFSLLSLTTIGLYLFQIDLPLSRIVAHSSKALPVKQAEVGEMSLEAKSPAANQEISLASPASDSQETAIDPVSISTLEEENYELESQEDPSFTEVHSWPPLKVNDILPFLDAIEGTADCGIDHSLNRLRSRFPNHNSVKVAQWANRIQVSPYGANFEIAKQFSKTGEHAAAFKWYEKSVLETTSPESFFQVGAAQLFGRGTVTNHGKAYQNLFQSLRGDCGDAAYLLGIAYLAGVGDSPNSAHAYRFFQKGIENGSRFGFGEAARMREKGEGIQKNMAQAVDLYIQGAQLGDTYCMERLIDLSTEDENGHSLLNPNYGMYWKQIRPHTKESWLTQEARRLLPQEFL